jgi:hypothetical protein
MIYPLNILGYLVAGVIVLILPGLALSLVLKKQNKDVLELLADSLGLSIALTALIALWAFIISWRFTSISVLFVYLLAGLVTLIIMKRHAMRSRKWYVWLAPLAGVAILLMWRFYQASDLLLPAWVDSIHHVLIVKVFLENGGIPTSLEPYLPVPFYYHFGFHALASVFAFTSGLPPERAVLIVGQVINAAVALSIYRLGLALWDDWRRAGLGALLVGFVSTMPAYYVSWGRYTLLIGLVLLPLAMAVALDIFRKCGSIQRLIHMAILVGGLLLSHYFAAILLAVFLVFLGIQTLYQDIRATKLLEGNRWIYLLCGALSGVALAGVWVMRTWVSVRSGINVSAITDIEAANNLYFPDYLSYLWRLLSPEHNYLLVGLAGLGLIMVLWERRSRAFGLWSFALILMSQPWGIQISPFRPDHAVIVLFVPVTLLASTFLISSKERFKSGRLKVVGDVVWKAAVLLILIWGGLATREIVNPATVLVSPADMQALEWIEANTSQGAHFFINVTYWQFGSYRGVDGGWWIMPLTGRDTLLPPVIYIMGEPDYLERVLAYAQKASHLEGCTAEFWELVEDARLTHVYVNRSSGPVHPDPLRNCPGLTLVYEKDGIFIFEVLSHAEG